MPTTTGADRVEIPEALIAPSYLPWQSLTVWPEG